MKFLLASTILLIISTSLCVNIPFNLSFDISNVFGNSTSGTSSGITRSTANQDVSLNVRYAVPGVRVGRDLFVTFELLNRNKYDLENVELRIFDNPCFDIEGVGSLPTRDIGSLRGEMTETWTWKFTPNSNIVLERTCPISYELLYDGVYMKYQDIAVLPEGEYFQREADGTLGQVQIGSTSSSSPLSINLKFSEHQPFLENQGYFMYFDYYDNGIGNFEDLNVSFKYPANIDASGCPSSVNDIKFVRGLSASNSCPFSTHAVSVIDIKSMEINANYKYSLDDSINIKVSA